MGSRYLQVAVHDLSPMSSSFGVKVGIGLPSSAPATTYRRDGSN